MVLICTNTVPLEAEKQCLLPVYFAQIVQTSRKQVENKIHFMAFKLVPFLVKYKPGGILAGTLFLI